MTTEITKIIEGFKQFSENSYLDSINFLREYIEVEPSSEAFFELGKALFFNENYEESITYLNKSSDYHSDTYICHDYFKMEDHESAHKYYERLLLYNPSFTMKFEEIRKRIVRIGGI
jgi:tetratricopeptide (TPR) repeat protein